MVLERERGRRENRLRMKKKNEIVRVRYTSEKRKLCCEGNFWQLSVTNRITSWKDAVLCVNDIEEPKIRGLSW